MTDPASSGTVAASSALGVLAACALWPGSPASAQSGAEPAAGFIETFDDAAFRDRWFFSNFDQGGEGFPTAWRRRMAEVRLPVAPTPGGGAMRIGLEPSREGVEKPFTAAELQRGGAHGHGDYEVYMRPAAGEGLVTGFFTYTGPYFGDPHDEIDIEFLGRDTTGIWVNRFVEGQGMPGRLVELGFDAAAAPNLYRFEWRADSIAWFANDREVFRVSSDEMAIPQTPGKLYLNLWAANERDLDWAGPAPPGASGAATIHCVSYRPLGDEGETCSDYVSADR